MTSACRHQPAALPEHCFASHFSALPGPFTTFRRHSHAMGLLEQVVHAWRGAKREVGEQRGVLNRARRVLRLVSLVARELAGTVSLAPYGVRAARCRRTTIAEGRLLCETYGPNPRNVIEVYLPAETETLASSRAAVLFVNGGVWSSGDPWQFAPLGRCLSDAGVVTFVCSYTLYPDATVPTMVAEVRDAVSWAQANAARFGAAPERLSVLGHSAGAHLAACAVLAHAADPQALPLHAFVGLAGVYHVRRHYAFETQRGVQSISTMEAAMGGNECFEEHSPSLQLTSAPDDVVARLPPVVLLSSQADFTVPWEQGEELVAPLLARGATACHVVYANTTHTHFATGWEYGARHVVEEPLLGHAVQGPAKQPMMAHAQDVLAVVNARVPFAKLAPQIRAARLPSRVSASVTAGRRSIISCALPRLV